MKKRYLVLRSVRLEGQNGSLIPLPKGSGIMAVYNSKKDAKEASDNGKWQILELEIEYKDKKLEEQNAKKDN